MSYAFGFVAILAMAGVSVTNSSVQASNQQARQGEAVTLPVVEVVGCLTSGPNNTWTLTNATDPVNTNSASTSQAAVKAAETMPLGKQRYVLLGVNQFNPTPHRGHKMAVKGILIKDQKETRINVTSFQMASADCTK